ncbi:hypothetical protein ATERTT37_000181 [Aspergillus terreus]
MDNEYTYYLSTYSLLHNHTMTLPSSTQFIETLLSQLSTHTKPPPTPTQDQGPRLSTLAASHPTLKPLLLTLHCIFPNELLLALDILDRRLVRRLIRDDNAPTNHRASQAEDLFYVISASAPPPRSAESDPLSLSLSQKGYELSEFCDGGVSRAGGL